MRHTTMVKDKDARWTKKNDASFFGYKRHLGVDKAHKLIRKWDTTDAADFAPISIAIAHSWRSIAVAARIGKCSV